MRIEKATADRLTAPILFALGAASAWGGWSMDRLEIRRIHPASIPGLLPILLGIALMVCAALLFASARRAPEAAPASEAGGSLRDLLVAGALCLIYAAGLVGNLSFGLATALFVAVFTLAFVLRPGDALRANALRAAGAAAYGAAVAVALVALFRDGFLVRMP